MQKEKDNNWYASWFDSPYYHILYKDRDYEEAKLFMNSLTSYLELPKNAKILDLACGKGRHSKYLSKLGYNVTGVDLSPSSINHAKKFEKENLIFKVHDMCKPYPDKFDAVFNLFTSFGYFENEDDNLKTIKAIKNELKPNGHGVIDFLNSDYIKKNIVPSEIKKVQGIDFIINRYIEDDYIIKKIEFTHNENIYLYTERVKALTLNDFEKLFNEANVTLDACFGDYKLNKFNSETSQRLILLFS